MMRSAAMIRLTGEDLAFARIAQKSHVSGATLPSGLKVPLETKDGKWYVFGNSIVLVSRDYPFKA